MAGILDRLRKNISASIWKDPSSAAGSADIDDKIALGVLLWIYINNVGDIRDTTIGDETIGGKDDVIG